jgi:hypothetical protein
LVDSILSGFIATFVLSVATFGAYGIARAFGDLTGNQFERWLYNLSHNTIIDSTHNSLALAIGLDLLVGIFWGIVYGFVIDRRMDGPGWRNGMIFALIPWLISIIIFFPVMNAGIFGRDLHAGPLPVVGNLILHLIYGAVLGWAFGFPMVKRLGDNEIDQRHNQLAEQWGVIGLLIGIPAGAIIGWIVGPSVASFAGRPVIALLAALIGAMAGLCLGTFGGLELAGEEMDRRHTTPTGRNTRPGAPAPR